MEESKILKFVGVVVLFMSIVTLGFLILGTIGTKKKIVTKEIE